MKEIKAFLHEPSGRILPSIEEYIKFKGYYDKSIEKKNKQQTDVQKLFNEAANTSETISEFIHKVYMLQKGYNLVNKDISLPTIKTSIVQIDVKTTNPNILCVKANPIYIHMNIDIKGFKGRIKGFSGNIVYQHYELLLNELPLIKKNIELNKDNKIILENSIKNAEFELANWDKHCDKFIVENKDLKEIKKNYEDLDIEYKKIGEALKILINSKSAISKALELEFIKVSGRRPVEKVNGIKNQLLEFNKMKYII